MPCRAMGAIGAMGAVVPFVPCPLCRGAIGAVPTPAFKALTQIGQEETTRCSPPPTGTQPQRAAPLPLKASSL